MADALLLQSSQLSGLLFFAQTRAPGVLDDTKTGVQRGTLWQYVGLLTSDFYVCRDASEGAAVWQALTGVNSVSAHATTHEAGGTDPLDILGLGAIPSSTRGVALGVATLDINGKIQPTQIPGGLVTSVGLSAPAQFSVAGSPVTAAGTLALSWASQVANRILASPNGASGVPTFRALVAADIPSLPYVAAGTATTSGLTMSTARLLGRSSAATGAIEEITIGSGLTLSGGVLTSSGATGTVTTVSVVSANGVSGSVANPTTTPAITLALGAITPTSVAASGTVTGSNLSGTNTGDQTISLTGDVTGSGQGSFAATISANVVTFGKFQQIATGSLLGRSAAATGNVEVISLGSGLTLSGGVLSYTGSGTIGGSIANTQVAFGSGANTIQGVSTFTYSGALLTLNQSGAALLAGAAGTVVQIAAAAGVTRVLVDSFGTGVFSAFAGRAARGTSAAPTALQLSDEMTHLSGFGYGATSYSSAPRAFLSIFAAENWTDTAQGTRIGFQTTAPGTLTTTEKVRFWGDGGVQIGGTFTASPGAAALLVSGAITASNLSGTNTGNQTITLTGDVTGTGQGSFAASIATNVVTLAKFQQIATNSILGRSTAATGNVEVITVGSGLSLSGGTLAATNAATIGGTIATGQIAVGSGSNTIAGSAALTFTAGQALVANGTTTQTTPVMITGSINNFQEFNAQNTSIGVTASTDIVLTADTGTATAQFIDLGVNGSGYTAGVMGAALEGYLYTSDQNLNIGAGAAAKVVRILAGGTSIGSNTIITVAAAGISVTGTLTVSSLTSARIPVVGTAGLLGDFSWFRTETVSISHGIMAGDGTGNCAFIVNGIGASNSNRDFVWASNTGSASTGFRWTARVSGTEAGSNAGSDWSLIARTDTGTILDTPIGITRAAGGSIFLARSVLITGSLTISALTSGRVPYASTAGLLVDSANLQFAPSGFASGFGSAGSAIQVSSTGANVACIISGPATQNRTLAFQTLGSARWGLYAQAQAEVGGNAGTGLTLEARDDAGAVIDNPLTIVRAAGGAVAITRPINQAWTPALLSGNQAAVASTTNYAPSGATTANYFGIITNVFSSAAYSGGGMVGTWSKAQLNAGATGTYNVVLGIQGEVSNQSAATITSATSLKGVAISNSGGGVITTTYGLFLDSQTAGGTNYAIFSNNGLVRFGDNVSTTGTLVTTNATAGGVAAGALQVAGGAYVAGSLYLGANCFLANAGNARFSVDTTLTATPANPGYSYRSNGTSYWETGLNAGNGDKTFYLYDSSTLANVLNVASGASGAFNITRPLLVNGASLTGSTAQISMSPTAATSGTPKLMTLAPAAHTGMTLSTEVSSINFNLTATRQWAAGALAIQREIQISAPTYAFVAASTITTAATLAISGAPAAGANATLTSSYALWIQSGTTKLAASVTAAAPLNVPHGTAPTTPVDGDTWTTTAGMFVQVSGATVGPLGAGGGGGGIAGSIANTQIAFGSGANTIQGSGTFTYAGSLLTLNQSGAALSAGLTGTVVQIAAATGVTRLLVDSFGTSVFSSFAGRSARGTSAAPTATQLSDEMTHLSGFGYGTTGYSAAPRAFLSIFAAENWTDTAQGTRIGFQTTAPGTLTTTEKVRFWGDGGVQIGGTFTASPGVGVLSVAGTITASNLSGTNTGNQTITLTGDVTGTGTSSFAATIAANAVTIAKFQQIPNNVILGRSTASVGNVEQIIVSTGLSLSGGILTATTTGTIGGATILNQVAFGAGTTSLQASTGFTFSSLAGLALAPSASVSGTPTVLAVTGPASTGLTASLEAVGVSFNLAATKQWATGALATQREVLISAPTYSFVAASTITSAATFAISGSPGVGANATITTSYALWVQAGRTQLDGLTVVGGIADLTGVGQLRVASSAGTSGTPVALVVVGAAHTGLTATAEVVGVNFAMGATKQWATGTIATQREVVITAPTYSAVAASTFTKVATFAITNAPTLGANATFGAGYAFWVQAGRTQLDAQVVISGAAIQSLTGHFSVSPTATTAGTPVLASFTGAANTGMTLSTEVFGVNFNFSATKQWATGALATQREVLFQAPTYGFVAASTVTTAATVAITNAPIAGTNATITNGWSLWVQAGASRFDARISVAGTQINTANAMLDVVPATAATSGTPLLARFVGAANTGMTLSTEVSSVNFNLAATKQWATGALTTQREVLISAPTYGFVAASTISDAATLAIVNAPIAGANATLTRSMALWVQAGLARFDGTLTTGAAVNSATLSIATAAGVTTGLTTDHVVVFTGVTTQTYTMPAAATGRVIILINRSSGSITVNRAGADTLNGGTTATLTTGQMAILVGAATDFAGRIF